MPAVAKSAATRQMFIPQTYAPRLTLIFADVYGVTTIWPDIPLPKAVEWIVQRYRNVVAVVTVGKVRVCVPVIWLAALPWPSSNVML